MIDVSPIRTGSPAGAPTEAQILADDRLIEAVRAGEIDADHADPLARMLARWRQEVLAEDRAA